MRPSWVFSRPFGIPLAVHLSWPPVFIFITWSLGAQFFPLVFPEWHSHYHWELALIVSLLLFASVLAHELGHALVAKQQGLPVRCVTLFLFGGVAEIESDARVARDEFLLAGAGPAVSLLLAVVCGMAWYAVAHFVPMTPESGLLFYRAGFGAAMLYLAFSNALLAAFNLIPAFPLDGARMLHAILWQCGCNPERVTIVLGWFGQGFGYLGVLGGLLAIFIDSLMTGIWLIALGWFLSYAARAGSRHRKDRSPPS